MSNSTMQFEKWHREGFMPERLAINVTLKQIENPHFIYLVSKLLEERHLNSKQLVFEITENNAASNSVALKKAFAMLSELGIQTSVGIFVLGHFALQKINRLPINYLKIDSQLLEDVMAHHESEVILEKLVLLAKEMNINIVAEDVDAEEQKTLLQALGCDVMQGKWVGPLLPAGSIARSEPLIIN